MVFIKCLFLCPEEFNFTIMKAKISIFLSVSLGLFIALCMASCNSGKTDKMKATIDSLSISDSLHQEDIKQMADFVNVMSIGLDSISAQEGLIKQMGSREGKMDKTQMRSQLQSLAELLRKQRARINELEAEVAGNNSAYGQRIKKLISYYKAQLDDKNAKIADLEKQLNDKNVTIGQLNESVNSLTSNNTKLQATVDDQNQAIDQQKSTIAKQDESLHTAFVSIGSSKELKAKGILKGGFLAKKKIDVASLKPGSFSKVDTRNYNDIHINSANPKVMTQMPSDSYSIEKNANGTSTLHIKDVQTFWSVSKYLVIKL